MNLREIYLKERLRQGQAGQMGQAGDEPALYFLDEVTALRGRTLEELREIHTAKLAFAGQRIIQDGPKKQTSKNWR